MFTIEGPLHSLALFSSVICTCTTSKRYKFVSKRTLDYFPKKYSEYANNWPVSPTAVRAETMDVTAHRVGCNTYLTRVITSQKLLQRVPVMLKYITNFFTRLLAYSGDLTEGPFWCKFYLCAKCALLTSRMIIPKFFQILSSVAGYGELYVCF